jgi:TolB protein
MALTPHAGRRPAEIYTIDGGPTGRGARAAHEHAGIDTSPAWSPDGNRPRVRVGPVGRRAGLRHEQGRLRRATVTFQAGHNTDPSWSPDGKSLAFVAATRSSTSSPSAVDGGGHHAHHQHAGDNEDPSFSPDGNYIASRRREPAARRSG